MQLTSPAFGEGARIPSRYTYDGANVSPPLWWREVPPAARSLALIVEDPDAPSPSSSGNWIHWVVYDVPPTLSGLEEATRGRLPGVAREGRNDWGGAGYRGPCPPRGRHHYLHRLFALDTTLPDLTMPGGAELERAMQGHVLATAQLTGIYQRRP